jgi:hypothetical protein
MSTSTLQNRSGVACAVLAFVVLSSGCAYGELRQVLRAEVASEADCPDVVVQKTSPFAPGYKENQFLVRGCSVDRVYTCTGKGMVKYGHSECTYTAGATATKLQAVSTPAADGAEPGPGAEPSTPDADMNAPDL